MHRRFDRVNATKRDDNVNLEAKSLSYASAAAVDPLEELAEYLRELVSEFHPDSIGADRFNSWLSALERTRQDARRYRESRIGMKSEPNLESPTLFKDKTP
jgi:hypothetical protein